MKATNAQKRLALFLLDKKGFGTKWMGANFKMLGATMRQRSGTVTSWLDGMNIMECSNLIDRLKKMEDR